MIAAIFVALVAIMHIYIMVLEMFLWTTPRALKTFSMTKETAESSKKLGANQGLYNGFLAAGLIWGLIHPNAAFGEQIQIFFLACVIVAALYGALTVKVKILLMQGSPAIIALLLVLFT